MKKLIIISMFLAPFVLLSQEVNKIISNNDSLSIQKDTSIVLFPDVEAKFPGGSAEMMKYFRENLEYPKIEFETVPDGRIFIKFIINLDGSIEQVKARKEGVRELDNAYIELIKNMPNWIPAEVNGVKVRSKMHLPFQICIQ